MDEYEKRMNHKAAIDSLTNIVLAFKPDSLLMSGKEKAVEGELSQRYIKRWIDMAWNFMEKAEALGVGYADYMITLLGLNVAKPENNILRFQKNVSDTAIRSFINGWIQYLRIMRDTGDYHTATHY